MVHRADTRTWEAVEDKNNDRILLQSSSELPADLKQDQQELELQGYLVWEKVPS